MSTQEALAAIDAAETAAGFDGSVTLEDRCALKVLASVLAEIRALAGDGPVRFSAPSLRPLRDALVYAAGTDAAITGEAYAGLSPDELRALAARMEAPASAPPSER